MENNAAVYAAGSGIYRFLSTLPGLINETYKMRNTHMNRHTFFIIAALLLASLAGLLMRLPDRTGQPETWKRTSSIPRTPRGPGCIGIS